MHVVQYSECSNLTLRYVDPRTGKQRRKSAKTAKIKDARKAAAVWEDELNRTGGASTPTGELSWAEFRIRYEREEVSSFAVKTAAKIAGVLNVLERALPVVANGRLRNLTAGRISTLQQGLREQGRAESTIAGHLAHLRAALQWAVDMELLAGLPKIKKTKTRPPLQRIVPNEGPSDNNRGIRADAFQGGGCCR